MNNIRLDYITNIEENAIEMMTDIRNEFITLDMSIQEIEECYPDLGTGENPAASRSLSIARTHLETALQFTIKALCLCGELK